MPDTSSSKQRHSILRRLVVATPAPFRPLVAALAFVAALLVAHVLVVLILRLFGEVASFKFGAAAYVGACACAGALAFGVLGSRISKASRSRPWLLGLCTSAVLWLTAAIPKPHGFSDRWDVLAFGLAVVGFGAVLGYLVWRHTRESTDA
jgi:hypothetical protein